MTDPLPIPTLLDEWLSWATWIASSDRNEQAAGEFIGHDEFCWIAQDHPEHAWKAILQALEDPRQKPFFGVLAAGPLEDLLSYHGPDFIDRVEIEARRSPKFAGLLGGVWKSQMTEHVWSRVQSVWDRSGWDGIPRGVAREGR